MVKTYTKLFILFLALCLAAASPRPARAVKKEDMADAAAAAAWTTLGVTTFLTFCYLAWINRPANQGKVDWNPKGPGGFYVGGYIGGSLVHSDDWRFNRLTFPGFTSGPVTASTIHFNPGVVGGLKLGYFFHSWPFFGLELETSFNRNDVRRAAVRMNPSLGESDRADVEAARLYIWTMAFHFMGRYGFLRDKEVPFGRLQPYVGIGPGFVIIYSWHDAAKNFSLDALAGLRYMIFRNLSTFVEYKFSQQWEVELDDQRLQSLGVGRGGKGTATFDFTNHKIVVGIAYHFL